LELSGGINFGFQHGFGQFSFFIPIIEILSLFSAVKDCLNAKKDVKSDI